LQPEIAENPRSSGAEAPDRQQRPAITGFFNRIFPALLISGGLIPRRKDIFGDLNCFRPTRAGGGFDPSSPQKALDGRRASSGLVLQLVCSSAAG
jgi:hypothetical protein